jgi:hypothetical protein
MIPLTDRPAQMETPLRYFLEEFTSNEAHYVSWALRHSTEVNAAEWRRQVTGPVNPRFACG